VIQERAHPLNIWESRRSAREDGSFYNGLTKGTGGFCPPSVAPRRYGPASFACGRLAGFIEPKDGGLDWARLRVALRRYGAASFAFRRLAGFTEPKLAVGERRMVDQTCASWNQLVNWLRWLDGLRVLA
jgi:hypothetical protein